MNVLEFWKGIELSSKVIEELLQINFEEEEYQRLCKIYKESHETFFDEVLKKESSAIWFLWLYSRMACDVYGDYLERGISEEIYWNTFRDIRFWCDNYEREYGKTGLGVYDWFPRHIDMTLFRLGRLQFEEMNMEYSVGEGSEKILKGTSVINIHIPQGAPLIWKECEKSLKMAWDFWGNDKLYVCHSWLLYPKLEEILSEDSNIREFRKYFKVIQTDFNEREGEWRIFGKVIRKVSDYPEETGLQKRAKEYLLKGKSLGNSWAVLEIENDL